MWYIPEIGKVNSALPVWSLKSGLTNTADMHVQFAAFRNRVKLTGTTGP